MSFITADDLKQAAKRRYKEFAVNVGGVEKTCRIQSLTELEHSRFEAQSVSSTGKERKERMLDLKRRLIVLCVVDEAGNRILTQDDVKAMEQADGMIIGKIFTECMSHLGITDEDVDSLAKNSDATDAG